MPTDRTPSSFIRLCTTLPLLTGMLGAAVLITVPFLSAGYGIALTVVGVVALVCLPCVECYMYRNGIRAWANVERQLASIAVLPESAVVAPEPIPVGTDSIRGWNRLAGAAREWRALEHLEERIAERLSGHRSVGRADVVLDSLGEGVGVTDLDGRLTLLNTALAAILGGTDTAEFQGHDLVERLSEHIGGENQLTQRKTPHGVPVSIDVERVHDGSRQFLRCVRRPQLNETSEVVGHVWSLRDITQQRTADDSREQFISTASHELRTPLANIKAYAETLELTEGVDFDQQKEFLNTINVEATRLGRFVDELLDVTRMQCGSLTLERRETDIERLVQDASGKVAAEAARKNIELRTEIPPKLSKMRVDKDKLAGAVVNLLGNAVKYTPEGGEVRFRVEAGDSQLSIVVEDTGIGIAENEVAKVFDRFFRSDSPKVQDEVGSGLGLAFTKEVARLHGGDVTVQSELGKGSRFVMTVPAT